MNVLGSKRGNSSGRQTQAELRELQRQAFAAVSHPLGRGGRMAKTFHDGRPMGEVVGEFIKPNDRLTAVERIELYNRQYWFRLMDCLWDDYPGLRALLGLRKFEKLRKAYLAKYPSRSFTLRNLGSRLVQFISEEPNWVAPHEVICLDMARFEWAQVVAFDGPALPPLTVDELLGKNPDRLRLGLQPYMTLLEMSYPLDDFVIALKKRDAAMRTEASNAVETDRVEAEAPSVRRPKKQTIYLAVHRHQNDLYYRRLARPEYQILSALRDGATLSEACTAAVEADPKIGADIGTWFRTWAEIGWFCKRVKAST